MRGDYMSNSIVIQFVSETYDDSPCLYVHWGGRELLDIVKAYINELPKRSKPGMPLHRQEPTIVMVDFLIYLKNAGYLGTGPVESSYYLYPTSDTCDYSDHGHYNVKLNGTKNAEIYLQRDTIDMQL